MDELIGAYVSESRLKRSALKKIYILAENLVKFHNVDTGQVTMEQITELQARLDEAKEALDKYDAAVIQCLVLEGKEEYDPDDEHIVELENMEDELTVLKRKVRDLKMMVREEESPKAEANAHEEPGNIVAEPPPMEKVVTFEELETWSSTWEDYYQVAKLEKEIPALQRPDVRGHLSQEMGSVVEHILGIGPYSTEKLDDRLLTKIMAELSDHENWKELLEEANGVMGQHEDLTWTWIVGLYSRSVIVTVFDRGKSPQEDTGRSPREDFDMTKHDMTNCCLVGWREG